MNEFSEIYLNIFYIGDQIITFIKDTKSRASCECFTLILHIYFPIRLHHVLRVNNEHLITSNGRRFFFFNSTINKFCHKNKRVFFSRYQYTANAPVLSDIDGSGPREKAYILKFYNIVFVFAIYFFK